jgi:hypothetical protein
MGGYPTDIPEFEYGSKRLDSHITLLKAKSVRIILIDLHVDCLIIRNKQTSCLKNGKIQMITITFVMGGGLDLDL